MSRETPLVLAMSTTIPLNSNMTVADLIKILELIPEKNARVAASHTSRDRGVGADYRLNLNWTKVINQ